MLLHAYEITILSRQYRAAPIWCECACDLNQVFAFSRKDTVKIEE